MPPIVEAYNALLNGLSDDEPVLFGDALHPTHGVRPVGCWDPEKTPLVCRAIART